MAGGQFAGRLGVSQPKPYFTRHPPKTRLFLTRRVKWLFNNRVVILTLIH